MKEKRELPQSPSDGLPFTRPVARAIVEELFRAQSQWKSGDLVQRTIQTHRDRGGASQSDPSIMVRRVLKDLEHDGKVAAPGHGWWRWTSDVIGVEPVGISTPVDISAPVDDAGFEHTEPVPRIEKELGAGSECVYLYYNPNDRKLAELRGCDVWECKIGRTRSADPMNRISVQGIRTALSRQPTIGLVLRTHDSASLESAIHAALRLAGAQVQDSPGNEWFHTSPARIEAWFDRFRESLVEIGHAGGQNVH